MEYSHVYVNMCTMTLRRGLILEDTTYDAETVRRFRMFLHLLSGSLWMWIAWKSLNVKRSGLRPWAEMAGVSYMSLRNWRSRYRLMLRLQGDRVSAWCREMDALLLLSLQHTLTAAEHPDAYTFPMRWNSKIKSGVMNQALT